MPYYADYGQYGRYGPKKRDYTGCWRLGIPLLIFAVLFIGGLVLFYSPWEEEPVNSEEEAGSTQSVYSPARPEDALVEVPEEYFQSVNALIVWENLKKSPLVKEYDEPYKLGDAGYANLTLMGQVTNVDVPGLTLTIEKDGDSLEIYIGKWPRIYAPRGDARIYTAAFDEIKEGDTLMIPARFQFGRGDPLLPYLVTICRY